MKPLLSSVKSNLYVALVSRCNVQITHRVKSPMKPLLAIKGMLVFMVLSMTKVDATQSMQKNIKSK